MQVNSLQSFCEGNKLSSFLTKACLFARISSQRFSAIPPLLSSPLLSSPLLSSALLWGSSTLPSMAVPVSRTFHPLDCIFVLFRALLFRINISNHDRVLNLRPRTKPGNMKYIKLPSTRTRNYQLSNLSVFFAIQETGMQHTSGLMEIKY
jgi:hypothetical protein